MTSMNQMSLDDEKKIDNKDEKDNKIVFSSAKQTESLKIMFMCEF